jgi:SAM-dependent methyltransferase
MGSEQAAFGFDHGGPDLERLREHDADFTPRGVVRQIVQRLRWLMDGPPTRRILDPAAGHGVYADELRRAFAGAHITAVEVRDECGIDLERYADALYLTAFEVFAETRPEPFDLIVTNPPFRYWARFVDLALQMLKPGGLVCFLGLSTWGQSATVAESFVPQQQLRVVGRIGYRGPGINPATDAPWGTDQRDYSHWLWSPTWEHRWWSAENLPALAAPDRTWSVVPGTEWRCSA